MLQKIRKHPTPPQILSTGDITRNRPPDPSEKQQVLCPIEVLVWKPSRFTMSKTKKTAKRKRQNEVQADTNKKSRPRHLPSPPDSSPSADNAATSSTVIPATAKTLASLVSPEEVEITVDTLKELTQHPAVIKTKGCKDLRAAVYDFRQACTTGVNSSSMCLFPYVNPVCSSAPIGRVANTTSLSPSRHEPHCPNLRLHHRRSRNRCTRPASRDAPTWRSPQTRRPLPLGSRSRRHQRPLYEHHYD